MIKIITGFPGAGGSTVVFNTLVNLFNDNGLDACLYSFVDNPWEGVTCKYAELANIGETDDDILIYHFMVMPADVPAKKIILSCHETKLFPIKEIKPPLRYDDVHFVSEFQKDWHGVEGTVIPNPIRKIKKYKKKKGSKVAGIIGSIDANKRTHLSIEKALDDGHTDIRIYGNISDHDYYEKHIHHLLRFNTGLLHFSAEADADLMYKELTHVYHSPELETFNLIKPECEAAGVEYIGNEGNDTGAEIWTNEKILEAWKTLLSS